MGLDTAWILRSCASANMFHPFKGFRLTVVFDSESRQKNFLKIVKEKRADFVLSTTLQKLSGSGLLDKIWKGAIDEKVVDITGK